MIAEVGFLFTTPCYLTCTIIIQVCFYHHTLLPNMYHNNRGRHSADGTFLPNIYHDNRGRLSAHLTLLSNNHHNNRGRHSAHHTLLPNMYHDNRGRLSAHHTVPPNMYHDNRGRLSAHHTLLPSMYYCHRGRLSAHHTLLSTGMRIFRFLADFHFLHGQFGHSRNLYRSAIKNVRGVGMFGVSLLGRLCCYTDDPLRSGFHVESVFY